MNGHKDEDRFTPQQMQVASKWIARQERGLSEKEQVELEQWLSLDPENEACYFEQQVTWASFDIMDEWKPRYGSAPNPDLFEKRSRRKSILTYSVVGLAAALALFTGAQIFFSPPQVEPEPVVFSKSYAAVSNERHFLEDGSSFYLKGGSELFVTYTAGERRVRLLKGEAFFNVQGNKQRPFSVISSSGIVTAVGTAFSVSQDANKWEVYVTEGIVTVGSNEAQDLRGISEDPETEAPVEIYEMRLQSGQKISQPSEIRSVPVVDAFAQEEVTEKFAWKTHMIDMVSAPLGEILAEFSRFDPSLEVELDNEALKDIRMTVSIRVDNVDDFLELLDVTMGLGFERSGNVVRIYNR